MYSVGEELDRNGLFLMSGLIPISVSDKIIALSICYHGYHEDTAIH